MRHDSLLVAAGVGTSLPPADPTYEWERNLPGYWISVKLTELKPDSPRLEQTGH